MFKLDINESLQLTKIIFNNKLLIKKVIIIKIEENPF